MAPSIASSWRSFWHTMTSYDRHADHDSPYRTNSHLPLPQSRHAPLTSVATSAIESRADLSSPYGDGTPEDTNGFISSTENPMSPGSPYSPGMRSALRRQSSEQSGMSKMGTGEIQMQNFAEGLPPPPPVSHSWKRIDRWAEDNYEELRDNLGEGCTQNDVNELEHQLDCTLPHDVRESLQIHDGQERGGLPTGIIFGCMLLDCEEIVQEWNNWRKVNEEYLSQGSRDSYKPQLQAPSKAFAGAGPSSSSQPPPISQQQGQNPLWRQDLLAKQDSQPPNAVQKAYAHPAWIPVARDWGGNNLAIDLAPGPMGKWGQVIIFGRDYDCKYVVSRSWASFLAQVADDLSASDKVEIDEEDGALRFRQFRGQNVDPPYLEVLRWRCDQKHGRRVLPQQQQQQGGQGGGKERRRVSGPGSGLKINSAVPPERSLLTASPYGSPTSAGTGGEGSPADKMKFPSGVQKGMASSVSPPSDRGRAMPLVSSPLARVAEEGPRGLKVFTNESGNAEANGNGKRKASGVGNLMEVDTPRASVDEVALEMGLGKEKEAGRNKENEVVGAEGKAVEGKKEEEMKKVEI
ncbi:cell wall assembly and cell proliferation coordinating protein [Aulographum hederae CBS 113979]|uniref:Cell wall assembly and cell proliferation coordinating protein n=1 Tax=Aulographum hederae CBS 113979 TaxID=1176131 RepID=A0A6G1GYG7_9PEZI|nr:cell wall assembly and cell proliferation coordinating protein [Aulographum hederae CBS 113979]